MKTKYILSGAVIAMGMMVSSCDLTYNPVSDYSDVTEGIDEEKEGETANQTTIYNHRADAESALEGLYQDLRGNIDRQQSDHMLIGDVHADNCYAGTTGTECTDPATNDINSTTVCVGRDWNDYMAIAARCTRFIVGIEHVKDNSLTDSEVKTMKAQAQIYRALIWFRMARIWGRIPTITTIPMDITAENIEEAYQAYFPAQNTEAEVYDNIVKDLEDGLKYAPDNNGDKTRLTKDVARALLAKVYAEKPIRDYNKVIQYCDELTANGYKLCDNYGDLFEIDGRVDEGGTSTMLHLNTVESILEAQYYSGSGSYASWLYGHNWANWDDGFTWAKWLTPSRDLIKAFDAVGDTERKNQTVTYYTCSWSNYYPSNEYAFMFKARSEFSTYFFLRYDDILLLKAEAYIMGDNQNLQAAADIIDQIRTRAKVAKLTAAEKASKDALFEAYVNERRLELAIEGERWFDLCRLDIVEKTMEAAQRNDPGRLPLAVPFTKTSYLLPIPQSVIDTNPNISQNPGY